MFSSRVTQNSAVLGGILRRLSLSNSDLRVTSSGFYSARPLVQEHASGGGRKRSLSFGSKPLTIERFRRMSSSTAQAPLKMNRLHLEKSPYLLQHAQNPVDWYPWGAEAFDKAKNENKLIFLSVGYSTCHWCHVMETESFENHQVAELLNENFVAIKVDREERPDVDKLYMSFVQATQGHGGWPMNVFLTPKLEFLVGGTYFPIEQFKQVLRSVSAQWQQKQPAVENSGKFTTEAMRKAINNEEKSAHQVPKVDEVAHKCFAQLTRNFDSNYGGFTDRPKFPQPSIFNFLFHLYSADKGKNFEALEMALKSLTKIANGGIHDFVNSGFHRYSVDEKWHVPHFEKMLYDQSQLCTAFCDAFVLTKDDFYANQVKDILKYVERDLRHKNGGFFAAEDADSLDIKDKRKKEGLFALWTYEDIKQLLPEDIFGIFVHHFNVQPEGNVDGHHKEFAGQNILICYKNVQDTAQFANKSEQFVQEKLQEGLEILYEERLKRPKPDLDTKIVTSWNGLMISGFAKAGFVLKNDDYIQRAIEAANFIKNHMYCEDTKLLKRCCYALGMDGEVESGNIDGFLDDYAFLIKGLLDLYEASLDANWLQWAEQLQEQQDKLFWDKNGGYFTSSALDTSILIRGKEDQDGAEPCGNSIAVHNLIRLAGYLDRRDLREKAGKTLMAFGERLKAMPLALPEMSSALLFYHNTPTQVFIAGKTEDKQTQALLDVVRSRFIPGKILAVADGPSGPSGLLYRRHDYLSRLQPVSGKSAAYVCRNFACSLPVTEPHDLADSLDDKPQKTD